jgi:5-methylcytosine-specific restriction endonuclease McrA
MTAMAEAMDGRVLVLNKHWQAVDVTKVWKAIHKVVNGRALFIDPMSHVTYEWEDWVLNWDEAALQAKRASGKTLPVGGIFEMVVPEVIVCTEYSGRGYRLSKRRPKFSRTNVYRRDANRCQYCDRKFKTEDLTLDHVVPKSKGGEMEWENIALACIPCNSKKDNRTPQQAGMKLIREPFKPKAEDLSVNPMDKLFRKVGRSPMKTWEQFLGKMYWEVELKD